MRTFSDQEKIYIKELYDKAKPGKCYLPANLFYWKFLENFATYYTGSHEFVFLRTVKDRDPKELILKTDNVLMALSLLDYLEKEGLIFYIKDKKEEGNNTLPYLGLSENTNLVDEDAIAIGVSIPPNMEEVLLNSMKYRVIVNETLIDYVENGFKTMEELQLEEARRQSKKAIESLKQAKKQTYWSVFAVIVAVITMIVTIAVQVCCTQSIRVEEVKPSVIQTIKKDIFPKHETEKIFLPAKQNNVRPISGNKAKIK